MKWERSDLGVGMLVVGGVLLIVGALLWRLPALGASQYPIYADFDRIEGIAEGVPVQLHGYEVGRVESVEPRVDPSGRLVFRVGLGIRRRLASGDTLHLPGGTRALLSPPLIPMGKGIILLDLGAPGGPPLAPGARIPGIPVPAALEQATAALGGVQTHATELTRELVSTLATARLLMDSLTRTAGVANQAVVATTGALPGLLQGVQTELEAAHGLTEDLRTHLGTLTPAAAASIDSANALMSDSRLIIQDMHRMMRGAEPELARSLASLDTTATVLGNWLRQSSDRPWKLFTGVKSPYPQLPPPPAAPLDSVAERAARPCPDTVSAEECR